MKLLILLTRLGFLLFLNDVLDIEFEFWLPFSTSNFALAKHCIHAAASELCCKICKLS